MDDSPGVEVSNQMHQSQGKISMNLLFKLTGGMPDITPEVRHATNTQMGFEQTFVLKGPICVPIDHTFSTRINGAKLDTLLE